MTFVSNGAEPMTYKKRGSEKSEEEELVYSTDAGKIVRLAKEAGFSDLEIMKRLLAAVYGTNARKRILISWAERLGKTAKEILLDAAQHGLIPNDRMPPKP
jgi:hypothetical protein